MPSFFEWMNAAWKEEWNVGWGKVVKRFCGTAGTALPRDVRRRVRIGIEDGGNGAPGTCAGGRRADGGRCVGRHGAGGPLLVSSESGMERIRSTYPYVRGMICMGA